MAQKSSILKLVASAALLIASSFAARASAAEVYVIYGPRGSMTFTSRKPNGGERYRLLSASKSGDARTRVAVVGPSIKPRPSDFDHLIQAAADLYELDAALVKAVVHVESSFRANARSHKGAMGLMQLMPKTAEHLEVNNPLRPAENIFGGARYLKSLMERYKGDVRLALAAYNAGSGAVERYRGVPPYAETREYVRRVLNAKSAYSCGTRANNGC